MQKMPLNLDTLDRNILNIIQTDFPPVARPFAHLASQLDVSEDDVIRRVAALKDSGLIRRIGGIFASDKLNFTSTLVALKVEAGQLETVAKAVSSLAGVTHNYEREHELNLWFTFVAESSQELEDTLNWVMNLPGVLKLRNLPALKLFKIGINFDLSEDGHGTD